MRFRSASYDVRPLLPGAWRSQIIGVASERAALRTLVAQSVTSREAPNIAVPALTVDGHVVAEQLPWLDELYRDAFAKLAATYAGVPVCSARNRLYGVNLNVQRGAEMRYECHVDSNPVQGILGVTGFFAKEGGEMVVSENIGAASLEEIEATPAAVVRPRPGWLSLFDASTLPHYVRPLRPPDDLRVVACFNYYTEALPEECRPADLSPHLYGRCD